MTREAALHKLLGTMFASDELRTHLALEREGEDLIGSLPEGTSHATLVTATIEALRRRGFVDRDFFDRLEVVRPGRLNEIRRVRGLWLHNAQLDRGEIWAENRYELLARLGGGGFGLVWRAIDTRTGIFVALKILHEAHADDRRIRQRFFRGAEVLSELSHPGIVRVRSSVEQEGLRFFYVMEYLDGMSLEDLVNEAPREKLLEHVFQIGDALDHIHARDLFHRDIKPSNILVTVRGQAKLIDFDLVTGATYAALTTRAFGTAVYAPPEATASDRKTAAYDVYSLARTVEFVIRGRVPTVAELAAIDPVIGLDVSDAVKTVLRAALCRDPFLRTNRVDAFCTALRAALAPISFNSGLFSDSSEHISDPEAIIREHISANGNEEPPQKIGTEPADIPAIAPIKITHSKSLAETEINAATPPELQFLKSEGENRLRNNVDAPNTTVIQSAASSSQHDYFALFTGVLSAALLAGMLWLLFFGENKQNIQNNASISSISKSAVVTKKTQPSRAEPDKTLPNPITPEHLNNTTDVDENYSAVIPKSPQFAKAEPEETLQNPITQEHSGDTADVDENYSAAVPKSPQFAKAEPEENLSNPISPKSPSHTIDADEDNYGTTEYITDELQPPQTPPPEPVPAIATCDREGYRLEGLYYVPCCPEDMRFIKGTGEHDFFSNGARREIADFCLDTTEVTVAAFRAKASAETLKRSKMVFYSHENRTAYSEDDKFCNARYSNRDSHPINCVDWAQASTHCLSIGKRLPTEWEWEWAARGRDEARKYPWGDAVPDCSRAIFSPGDIDGCGKNRTWSVSSLKIDFSGSRDGVQDMSGNVDEWTDSLYNGSSVRRPLRGGRYLDDEASDLRVSARHPDWSRDRNSFTGFRCARAP